MESLLIGICGFSLTVAVILWAIVVPTGSDKLGTVAVVPTLIAAASFAALLLIAML